MSKMPPTNKLNLQITMVTEWKVKSVASFKYLWTRTVSVLLFVLFLVTCIYKYQDELILFMCC